MKRIGLFGGTFDPIHLGHLRAALEAGIAFQLDPVLMIPSAQPPHKDTEKITSAEDRLEMARLATAAAPRLVVSDMEYGRKGPSYTVETIERLQQKWGAEAELNLIIGLDAFRKYDTWYRFHDLFRITSIIVLIRPEMEALTPSQAGTMLESHLGRTVSGQYRFDPSTRCIMHPQLKTVHILTVTRLDISSSRIRQLAAQKKPICFLVPERVAQYIDERGLY